MPPLRLTPSVIFLTLFVAAAAPVTAQVRTSLGGGLAVPTGDLGDVTSPGLTVRGQIGVSLGLVEGHVQAGWSRFPGSMDVGDLGDGEDADVWHGGAGLRVGFGMIWVGANALYSFGDTDDGMGFAPEVGVGLGPIEIVADYLFGTTNWFAVRAAFGF